VKFPGRLQRIIDRGRKEKPGYPGILLLLHGLIAGSRRRFNGFIINFRKDSTFTAEKDLYMCSLFPKKVLDLIIAELKPGTVLDVGCGTGVSLEYFLKYGLKGTGIENSLIAISKSPVKENIIRHNLNKEIDLRMNFDIVWCFEVIEHIHPDFEGKFLRTLANHSNTIILSAAKPGQGGHGHFNEQLPEYWIRKFSELGYLYNNKFSESLQMTGENHAENILCFSKEV
jgi:SAM-dependent methyltransferase